MKLVLKIILIVLSAIDLVCVILATSLSVEAEATPLVAIPAVIELVVLTAVTAPLLLLSLIFAANKTVRIALIINLLSSIGIIASFILIAT